MSIILLKLREKLHQHHDVTAPEVVRFALPPEDLHATLESRKNRIKFACFCPGRYPAKLDESPSKKKKPNYYHFLCARPADRSGYTPNLKQIFAIRDRQNVRPGEKIPFVMRGVISVSCQVLFCCAGSSWTWLEDWH